MAQIFADNLSMLARYAGRGFLFALYVPAVVYLFLKEKERWKRIVLIYVPLVIFAVFVLPPATLLYRTLIGNDGANYRILWMMPFAVTVAYAGIKAFASHKRIGLLVMCAAVVLSGQCVYKSVYISRAENAYHLPQIVINLCDRITEDREGRVLCAFPPEMIHQVRQYNTDLMLVYGRASVEPSMHLYNAVYEEMVVPDIIRFEGLDEALRNAAASYLDSTYDEEIAVYLIMHKTRACDADPVTAGYELIDEISDYRIYKKVFT